MKKISILGILLIVSTLILAGCSRGKKDAYFNATVLEVRENSVLVEPFEGSSERESADQIVVSCDVSSDHEVPEMKQGTMIRVVYDGMIAESYPAQINGVSAIYLVDADGEITERDMELQVTVKQGEDTLSLYEFFVFENFYDEKMKTWVAADGMRLSNALTQVANELPVAEWGNEFSVQIPEKLELYYVDIFDSSYEKTDRLFYTEQENPQTKLMENLAKLSEGVWYISVAVNEQGKYIEDGEEYEAYGREYAFRLEKKSVQPDGGPISINREGVTVEERFPVPEGYRRAEAEEGSFLSYMRKLSLKPDGSPVLLYDGTEKGNQEAHAAVFELPGFDSDLQQCADSIIRVYAEYFYSMGAYDKIAFHLTNGFLMDYPTWRDGNRLSVDGNQVSWVKKASYDDSYDTFLLYLKYVMMYAGTLSLDKEGVPADPGQMKAGDLFIKGGSPGHCVMVADIAVNDSGNTCFLLAQGYMPAQDFHILKNPLHEGNPWYDVSEIAYPFRTPEYTFQEGSFKRWGENGILTNNN